MKRATSIYLALMVLLSPIAANADPVGLVHLWEAEGDTTDSVGGVTGSLVGDATYAAGYNGQAFSFDGAGDRFEAAVDIGPSAFAEITFGAWVYLDAYDNSRGWVIGHDNGGYDRSISLHDNRYSESDIKPAAGVGRTYVSTLADIALGEWNFVAVSYQGNGNDATVFFNGQTQVVNNVNNSNGVNFFTVGGLVNYANHEIDGRADDIFIFNRALSVHELNSVYENGFAVPEPGTLALLGLGLIGMAARRRKTV